MKKDEKNRKNVTYILLGLLALSSFVIGSLYTKVQYLEKGAKNIASNKQNSPPANEVVLPTESDTMDNVPKITKDDHIKGDKNAQIALIEYSDLECPFCKRFHPTAQQAVDTYKGKLMWVYRHFPLVIHVNAQKEAEASECAYDLGGHDAFWKYVDKIMDRTTTGGTGFSLDQLVPLAKENGLNSTKFKSCLDSGNTTQRVKDIMDQGAKAGIRGTPGNILLNIKTGKTKLIPGAVPFEQLKQAIDEML